MPDSTKKKTESTAPPNARLFLSQEQAERSTCDACVVASQDRWNDFGYALMADIGLRKPDASLEC
ncbi:hypothetical protein [Variovorax paradoxus]|uniref:hypothetical protein n=1 Tax=Variovorax paradoxus TaxID=34073 RepID=UPI0030D60AF4